MRDFYTSNKWFETKKHFLSYFSRFNFFSRKVVADLDGLRALRRSLIVLKQSFHPAQQGRQMIRLSCLFLLLAFSRLCQAQTPPADGLYSFKNANPNSDGTYTSADGFFLISGNNGSSDAAALDDVAADEFGAYMVDNAADQSGTSYLEIKVKNGGSFQIVSSVIGDYSGGGGSNDFFNVYAAGLANGVQIATTPAHNSTGVVETNYNLDFSAFAGKSIDAFRVYYSWNSGTAQTDFNLESMTISGASSTPPVTLPVTWLSFSAKKQDRAVKLDWSTAVEQNTKDFIVQHSANGRNWSMIGSMPATGNSGSVQVYSFLHQYPVNGANFYRLLQRDIDGRESYSKVVSVDFAGAGQALSVYPNPVTDGTLTVRLQNAATVQIYNSLGTMVLQKSIPGGGELLNLGQLPKGLYTVKAGDKTASFIVQ